jgi:hypothetical protein
LWLEDFSSSTQSVALGLEFGQFLAGSPAAAVAAAQGAAADFRGRGALVVAIQEMNTVAGRHNSR